MSASDPSMNLMLDEIDVSDDHRAVDPETVKRLAKSVKDLGLHHPITVIRGENRRFILVAGRHRLEAFRHLGEDRIPAQIVKLSGRDARMWEISENLHRAELTTEQRYEQIAEYAKLAKEKREEDKPRHSDAVSGGRGNEGGTRLASRDLGIPEPTVRRAQEYASLPSEVKEEAISKKINVTALLRERDLADAKRANRTVNEAIALTEAERFAEWLNERIDQSELPQLISWLEGCKPREVIAALRREAA